MTQRLLLLVALLGTAASCGSEPVEPDDPIGDPSRLYGALTLNQRAINLATTPLYDTFRLAATPYTVDGTPLEGLQPPTFTSSDPDVPVSPDGLIRAFRAVSRVMIVAAVQDVENDITHADTVWVNVTASPSTPALDSLSLQPSPLDSATWTMDGTPWFTPSRPRLVMRAFGVDGTELSGLAVRIESSDLELSNHLNVNSGQTVNLAPAHPGVVVLRASTMAYGMERTHTLEYKVGPPLGAIYRVVTEVPALGAGPTYRLRPPLPVTPVGHSAPAGHIAPGAAVIGVGGYVGWLRTPKGVPAFDITFEDPADVAADVVLAASAVGCGAGNMSGNIAPFGDTTGSPQGNLCARHFPVAGTYRFHSAALKTSGTVVVLGDNQPPSPDLEAAGRSPVEPALTTVGADRRYAPRHIARLRSRAPRPVALTAR